MCRNAGRLKESASPVENTDFYDTMKSVLLACKGKTDECDHESRIHDIIIYVSILIRRR